MSGRVQTSNGRAISNVNVRYTHDRRISRTAMTNPFGYFTFDEVEAGRTYVFQTTAKGYNFTPRVISVNDDLTNLTIVPIEQN